jgi:hypothetical protein
MTYSEKLRDPRWQKKRLEIFERDNFTCKLCNDTESTLNVHHHYYENNKEPWEYPNESLITLCENCHENETNERKVYENNLLGVLRRTGIMSNELLDIVCSLNFTSLNLSNRIDAQIFKFWMMKDENVNIMREKYFEYLKEKNINGIL